MTEVPNTLTEATNTAASGAKQLTFENINFSDIAKVAYPYSRAGIWPNMKLVDAAYYGQLVFSLGRLDLVRVKGWEAVAAQVALNIVPVQSQSSFKALLGNLTAQNSVFYNTGRNAAAAVRLGVIKIGDTGTEVETKNIELTDLTIVPTVACKNTGYTNDDSETRAENYNYHLKNSLMKTKPEVGLFAVGMFDTCFGVLSLQKGAGPVEPITADQPNINTYQCNDASYTGLGAECKTPTYQYEVPPGTKDRLDIDQNPRPKAEETDVVGAHRLPATVDR